MESICIQRGSKPSYFHFLCLLSDRIELIRCKEHLSSTPKDSHYWKNRIRQSNLLYKLTIHYKLAAKITNLNVFWNSSENRSRNRKHTGIDNSHLGTFLHRPNLSCNNRWDSLIFQHILTHFLAFNRISPANKYRQCSNKSLCMARPNDMDSWKVGCKCYLDRNIDPPDSLCQMCKSR